MSEEYISYREYKENKRAEEALEYLYEGPKQGGKWGLKLNDSHELFELKEILNSINIEIDSSKISIDGISQGYINENGIEDKVVLERYPDELTKSKVQTRSEIEFKYTFCNLDEEFIQQKKTFDGYSTEQVLKILQDSSDKCIDSEWKNNRRIVRAASSIALNERGIAPEFRDAKSGVTHKVVDSLEERIESNDRQVIDMHWLYLHHKRDIKPTDFMKSFFAQKAFDYEEATQFVATDRPTTQKIKRIGIPEKVQKLLLSLRSLGVLKFQKSKRIEMEELRLALINRSSSPRSRLNEDSLEQNLAAFRCLLYGDLSVVQALEYWKTLPSHITSEVTQQLHPWVKGRLRLLNEMRSSND